MKTKGMECEQGVCRGREEVSQLLECRQQRKSARLGESRELNA